MGIRREELHIRYSFSMWHRNSEIWVENLDGMYELEDAVIKTFTLHMETIERMDTPPKLAIYLYHTMVTEAIAKTVVSQLKNAGVAVRQVAFVGITKEDKDRIQYYLNAFHVEFACRFFKEFLSAKNWLG